MERTSKPIVAGILMIISGALSLLGVIFLPIVSIFSAGLMGAASRIDWALGGLVFFLVIAGVIFTMVSIIGGVYALKRRLWGLALAGSIVSVLQTFFLGVPALILVVMSKDEFDQSQ